MRRPQFAPEVDAITIDQPTPVADFPPDLAEAVAATLRAHGMAAEVVEHGEAAEVVVPGARREEAVSLMAAQMDEIRDRLDDEPQRAGPAPTEPPPESGDEQEPGAPLLATERLRRLWPVPVLLVPLLVLLGSASVPANFAVLVLIGGMVAVVALRQRRRER